MILGSSLIFKKEALKANWKPQACRWGLMIVEFVIKEVTITLSGETLILASLGLFS